MTEHRFDGRVAVVTGAGRGLGRAYAGLLAARGASVIVNDRGGARDGTGSSTVPATSVADAIVEAGGSAVADAGDVSDPAGAAGLIETAMSEFGRIDILINNAGITRPADVIEAEIENFTNHLNVHLFGSIHTTRAAWPHLVQQGYGRIVMTTSSAILGSLDTVGYAMAKAAVVALARHLRVIGGPHGIKTNLISPAAYTRLARSSPQDEDLPDKPPMSPDLVAPLVALLAHESCPTNGDAFSAGGGRFSRMFIAETKGYVQTARPPTIEDVADHWADINDETGYYAPVDITAWLGEFLQHVAR